MKRLLGIGLVLVTCGLGPGCTSSLKTTPVRAPTAVMQHVGDSTVALVLRDDEGDVRPYCTGVWIGETQILTANHCVAAAARHIKGKDEGEVDPVGVKIHYIIQREVSQVGEEPTAVHLAHVQAVDEDHDLALVKAEVTGMPGHDFAEVVSEMPGLGEHVSIVGHPKGLYWSYIDGVVSAYRTEMPIPKDGPFVQISGSVWFGNSGGGAFDSHGDLVGIASMLTRVPNTSLFIHADSIKRFLKAQK